MMSLERFHEAQAARWAGYSSALAEIRNGRKSSHWIWYIFPQIDGLGRSSTARSYALRNLDEACDYLRDPLLRARYEEISETVAKQLENGALIENLMGGSIDALKLASSLTLFRAAASRLAGLEPDSDFEGLAERCNLLLQRIEAQGYATCQFTLERCLARG